MMVLILGVLAVVLIIDLIIIGLLWYSKRHDDISDITLGDDDDFTDKFDPL